MYRPLPKELTIKNSPIEGLGLYAKEDIKKNTFIGVTHIRDEQFENKYIRTPLGGFYNHSNKPNVRRMVSNVMPKLQCGDLIKSEKDASRTKAIEIFPYFSANLSKKKDANKADAILIARFFHETVGNS